MPIIFLIIWVILLYVFRRLWLKAWLWGIIKILLIIVLVLLYVMSPIDLIPDFIPIAGWIDDLGVVGYGVKIILNQIKNAAVKRGIRELTK